MFNLPITTFFFLPLSHITSQLHNLALSVRAQAEAYYTRHLYITSSTRTGKSRPFSNLRLIISYYLPARHYHDTQTTIPILFFTFFIALRIKYNDTQRHTTEISRTKRTTRTKRKKKRGSNNPIQYCNASYSIRSQTVVVVGRRPTAFYGTLYERVVDGVETALIGFRNPGVF